MKKVAKLIKILQRRPDYLFTDKFLRKLERLSDEQHEEFVRLANTEVPDLGIRIANQRPIVMAALLPMLEV